MLKALPQVEALNNLSDDEAVSQIRVLFEAAPVLEAHILSLRPWKSYDHIIDASERFCLQLLVDGRTDDVLAVLNAHPKIGTDPAKLSADSKQEQGEAGDPAVLKKLAELNDAYDEKFGFRFVVFVNGRPKDAILKVLQERMHNERQAEMQTAVKAMMDIARDRLGKRSKI